jgi:hypothetical protein
MMCATVSAASPVGKASAPSMGAMDQARILTACLPDHAAYEAASGRIVLI